MTSSYFKLEMALRDGNWAAISVLFQSEGNDLLGRGTSQDPNKNQCVRDGHHGLRGRIQMQVG